MPRSEPVLFSEAQTFRQWQTRIVLAFPPAAVTIITLRQVVWHKPWGSPPSSNSELLFLTALLVGVYLRLITVKLVTEVRRSGILVGLRGLWKRRRIPLGQIHSARVVNFNAATDFGGYGIRDGPRGTAYIARGDRAVELALASGRKVLIGSQHPSELARLLADIRKPGSG